MTADVRVAGSWSAVVPVKLLAQAKTRLRLPAGMRAEVALAMATDVVSALLLSPMVAEVVVVTDDVAAARRLADIGARVVSDAPAAGLNPALAHGLTNTRRAKAFILSSDVPAVRSDDLVAVLDAVPDGGAGAVADVTGTGTSLLAIGQSGVVRPQFGAASFLAHRAAGAVDLSDLADARLRHDVDTIEDLLAAAALGVGAATSQLLPTVRRALATGVGSEHSYDDSRASNGPNV